MIECRFCRELFTNYVKSILRNSLFFTKAVSEGSTNTKAISQITKIMIWLFENNLLPTGQLTTKTGLLHFLYRRLLSVKDSYNTSSKKR